MLDSLGMWPAALGLPDQLASALDVAPPDDLPGGEGLRSVTVMGMGGSGIAGDVAAAVAAPTCPLPVSVSKHYECPAHVGADTLVMALSFSGNTEETLAALGGAADAGARIVVVAAGGELERFAADRGAAFWRVDGSIPMPRAAIGAMSVPPLRVLEEMGLLPGATRQIRSAVDQLRRRVDAHGSDPSAVARAATRIGRHLPLVYGGGLIGEVAARRWKGQFNENPKVASFANTVPELTHNEVCGWAQHGDVTRQVFSLVLLRHDHEHPQVARRMEMVAEICDEVVGDVLTVRAEGDSPLAQLMDLVLVGDLVSLQMAAVAGVDPGPVPILEDIKARLASD